MINTTELMRGDWVQDGPMGFPMYVTAIFEDTAYLDFEGNEGDVWELDDKDLTPIDITGELLESIPFSCNQVGGDIGWEKTIGEYRLLIRQLANTERNGWSVHISNEDFQTAGYGEFLYLHELQNIIRQSIHKELEVKL